VSKLRVACSPLTGTIYAGRVRNNESVWQGEKYDVTSDVIGAIIHYVGTGNVISVNENGSPAFEIEVRAIKAEAASNENSQRGSEA
jgi:hypothetical protein